jgi:hypothetical protein
MEQGKTASTREIVWRRRLKEWKNKNPGKEPDTTERKMLMEQTRREVEGDEAARNDIERPLDVAGGVARLGERGGALGGRIPGRLGRLFERVRTSDFFQNHVLSQETREQREAAGRVEQAYGEAAKQTAAQRGTEEDVAAAIATMKK